MAALFVHLLSHDLGRMIRTKHIRRMLWATITIRNVKRKDERAKNEAKLRKACAKVKVLVLFFFTFFLLFFLVFDCEKCKFSRMLRCLFKQI